MTYLRFHVLFSLLGLCLFGYSQDSISYTEKNADISLRGSFSMMYVLPTHDYVRSENVTGQAITDGRNVSVEMLFQANGKRDWHQLYDFPKYGFGLQKLWFTQTDEIGSPIAVYSILEGPIKKWNRSYFSYKFHFGFSYGWNPYDEVTNPYNYLMGGPLAIYAHVGALYHQDLNKRWGLEASVGFSHSSNGNLKQPNFGINLFDPRIALTYQLQKEQQVPKSRELAPFEPNNEVTLSMAMGTKQLNVFGTDSASQAQFGETNFTIVSWVLVYHRQVSRRSRIGAGIDFTIDPSDNAHAIVVGNKDATYPAPFSEQAKLALVLSYEFDIGKLAVVLQPGFYFYRTTYDPTPFFYQRIGAKYNFYKGFYLGTALRAVNFGQADWVEFTAGYKYKF